MRTSIQSDYIKVLLTVVFVHARVFLESFQDENLSHLVYFTSNKFDNTRSYRKNARLILPTQSRIKISFFLAPLF